MSHTPHELTEEFPGSLDAIHALRTTNAHFAQLAERYRDVNRTLHRMETNLEPADDFTIEDLKKQRLRLMDEIAGYLHA
ncbi:MAG: YdcH family protein [Hyphomicrobiales bacterium]|nr:YdcH family protein [Hyphomicrobiales bacterium]